MDPSYNWTMLDENTTLQYIEQHRQSYLRYLRWMIEDCQDGLPWNQHQNTVKAIRRLADKFNVAMSTAILVSKLLRLPGKEQANGLQA